MKSLATLDDIRRHVRLVKRARKGAEQLILGRWWSLRVLWRGWKMLRQAKRTERQLARVLDQRTRFGFRCSLTKKKQRQLGILPPVNVTFNPYGQ